MIGKYQGQVGYNRILNPGICYLPWQMSVMLFKTTPNQLIFSVVWRLAENIVLLIRIVYPMKLIVMSHVVTSVWLVFDKHEKSAVAPLLTKTHQIFIKKIASIIILWFRCLELHYPGDGAHFLLWHSMGHRFLEIFFIY